jgi:hypothetical protein
MTAVSTVEVSAVALKEHGDKVDELAIQVAVLTTQHGYMLETLNRLESMWRDQATATGDFRGQLQQQLTDVTRNVVAVEARIETVAADLAKLADRTTWGWLRKNAPIIGVTVAALTGIAAVVRWMLAHIH